jgi:hypothetical protein
VLSGYRNDGSSGRSATVPADTSCGTGKGWSTKASRPRSPGLQPHDDAVGKGPAGSKPQTNVFAKHLRRFRDGGPWAPGVPASQVFAVSFVGDSTARPQGTGPGWLRQALAAARSMAQFVGSGCKMATAEQKSGCALVPVAPIRACAARFAAVLPGSSRGWRMRNVRLASGARRAKRFWLVMSKSKRKREIRIRRKSK